MMTGRGDIIRCRDCGLKVQVMIDWRGRTIMVDPPYRDPPDWVRISYVETELGDFEPVYRHDYCKTKLDDEPAPNDGRDVRPTKLKGPKPELPAPPKPPEPQGDLFE